MVTVESDVVDQGQVSAIGPSVERWSEARVKADELFGFVLRLEEELISIDGFANRRSRIQEFKEQFFPCENDDWVMFYAMFMGRNPYDIPYRLADQRQRSMTEKMVYLAGTVEKEGRNFRKPGSMGFNVRIKQKETFRSWSWPAERTTTKGCVVEIGPHDEVVPLKVLPPDGETWASLAEAQDVSQPQAWVEPRVSGVPGLNHLRRVKRQKRLFPKGP